MPITVIDGESAESVESYAAPLLDADLSLLSRSTQSPHEPEHPERSPEPVTAPLDPTTPPLDFTHLSPAPATLSAKRLAVAKRILDPDEPFPLTNAPRPTIYEDEELWVAARAILPYKQYAQQLLFCRTIVKYGLVALSAHIIGISTAQHSSWLNDDPTYPARYYDAKELNNDLSELEMRRRGIEGVLEPIFKDGVEVGRVRKYSNTMLIALMAAEREKFRKTKREHVHEISGPGGGPIETALGVGSLDQLMQLRKIPIGLREQLLKYLEAPAIDVERADK